MPSILLMRARVLLVLCLTAMTSSSAHAVPSRGAKIPALTVVDSSGAKFSIPHATRAVILQYEDSSAGKQNVRFAEEMSRFTRIDANKQIFEFMAVADVEKYAWWPAKNYVIKDIKAVEKKNNTTVYIDWSGAIRKTLGFSKHKSAIAVIKTDGTVLFAAEGALSDEQLADVSKQVESLGAKPLAERPKLDAPHEQSAAERNQPK